LGYLYLGDNFDYKTPTFDYMTADENAILESQVREAETDASNGVSNVSGKPEETSTNAINALFSEHIATVILYHLAEKLDIQSLKSAIIRCLSGLSPFSIHHISGKDRLRLLHAVYKSGGGDELRTVIVGQYAQFNNVMRLEQECIKLLNDEDGVAWGVATSLLGSFIVRCCIVCGARMFDYINLRPKPGVEVSVYCCHRCR
jgi:hypothetical protein